MIMASNNRNNFGVEVCLEELDNSPPECPHGPTLLFESYKSRHKGLERYYACSACRDRKECNFYQKYGTSIPESKKKFWNEINRKEQPPLSHKQYFKRFLKIKQLKAQNRKFCRDCNQLLLPNELPSHLNHQLCVNLSEDQLTNPSKLFQPLENNKTNAQYMFSDKTVEFVLRTLEDLQYKKVLCIGCPRIHEAIVALRKQNSSTSTDDVDEVGADRPKSLLLDIDYRYQQFYSPQFFCRYNMFNHHFFSGKESRQVFLDFLCGEDSDSLIVITDPPFGGLVEVLAHTLKKISRIWQQAQPEAGDDELPVMWIFPYFLELRILGCLPSFTMLDYKVDYDNHDSFQGGPKGRKVGSPIRIFTNIPPSSVKLPKEEGYRFCGTCDRFVAEENVHCKKCNACTSKDGHQYVHCDDCGRCVKPSRIHCDICGYCVLQDHTCGQTSQQGCYLCGDTRHKKRDCPRKYKIYAERHRNKRKAQFVACDNEGAKKRRRQLQQNRRPKWKKRK